jgi:hypothetical protein
MNALDSYESRICISVTEEARVLGKTYIATCNVHDKAVSKIATIPFFVQSLVRYC